MNYSDAQDVVAMVVRTWPGGKEWSEKEMDAYATGLMRYDAATCVAAVAAAQQKLMYRPSVAGLREFYDLERAKTRAQSEKVTVIYPKKERVPAWVRRWVAARYLHRQFGREQDLRRFPEQQGWANPDLDLMPADAWLEEAEHVTEERVWKTLTS